MLIQHISAQANAPADSLQTILLELKNVGLLKSRRGPQRGYRLLTPPNRISVGSIVRIIDGPFVTLPCVGKEEAHACADCRNPDACQTRFMMREVHEAVTAIMDHTTLLSNAVV
jgi:Rrf2 family protein